MPTGEPALGCSSAAGDQIHCASWAAGAGFAKLSPCDDDFGDAEFAADVSGTGLGGGAEIADTAQPMQAACKPRPPCQSRSANCQISTKLAWIPP